MATGKTTKRTTPTAGRASEGSANVGEHMLTALNAMMKAYCARGNRGIKGDLRENIQRLRCAYDRAFPGKPIAFDYDLREYRVADLPDSERVVRGVLETALLDGEEFDREMLEEYAREHYKDGEDSILVDFFEPNAYFD